MTPAGARAPLDFVVVGAQRSATTHLTACLRGHPEIFMCADEVPFFESPFYERSAPSALEDALVGAADGQRRGIQRPDYLARPECPGNIHEMAPQARILAVLRDPVERAISAYHWYVQFGLLPLLPLDEGIERLLDGWSDPAHPRASEIIDLGFYGRHLSRYVEVFGSDQVLVLLGEDLRSPTGLARVFGFLDVDERHEPPPERRRTNAGTYEPHRLRVLRARRRFAWSWEDVTEYTYAPRRRRRPIASLVSAAVVAVDRVVLARVFGDGPPPALRPELEHRLRATFADDVQLLEELVGRDLGSWRTGAARRPAG